MTMSVSTQENDIADTEYVPMVVHLPPFVNLTDDQFFDFCQVNRDLRIEQNEFGELIIMPPAGGESSQRNAEITIQLGIWAKRDGTGITFDSSAGFRLPNGATSISRCGLVATVAMERVDGETKEEVRAVVP